MNRPRRQDGHADSQFHQFFDRADARDFHDRGGSDLYFREMEIAPATIMEVASIGAIKELVKLGIGVSVLAPWTVHHELARGGLKMRPLGSKPLRRQWGIISLASRRLTLAEESFCRLV